MRIMPNFNQKQQKTNFKQGLTSSEINAVRNMKPFEFVDVSERLKNRYNLDAYFGESNTVAWCVEQVAEIMTKAGFKLPKNFAFIPLKQLFEENSLGIYQASTDTVCINSDYSHFRDLVAQNKKEESQGIYHPVTKHFLHTYLHEFSHAAHFHNLCDKHGKDNALSLFNRTMAQHTPEEFIVGPINKILKMKLPRVCQDIIDMVVPPTDGLYGLKELTEYFAEKNSRYLAQQLGKNYIKFNIKDNFADSYTPHPANWDLFDKIVQCVRTTLSFNPFGPQRSLFDTAIKNIDNAVKLCYQEIIYTDGDIYHGNMDNLNKRILIK